jgi:hypothetical protein
MIEGAKKNPPTFALEKLSVKKKNHVWGSRRSGIFLMWILFSGSRGRGGTSLTFQNQLPILKLLPDPPCVWRDTRE